MIFDVASLLNKCPVGVFMYMSNAQRTRTRTNVKRGAGYCYICFWCNQRGIMVLDAGNEKHLQLVVPSAAADKLRSGIQFCKNKK
mmetsp:Transcript_42681/g.70736  ORF Transcript_42681/g.70736 Transcript_42681/m.70736 type:complete len:85 (-) Transcript_42681:14-268(-)